MPIRLTLTSNGCDLERGRGQQHVGRKALRDRNRCRSAKGQGKTCMVNAKLRESQTWYLRRGRDAQRLMRQRRERRSIRNTGVDGSRGSMKLGFDPVARTTPHRGAKGRTGHLFTSDLCNSVNTGSPKRAGFIRPARRRSRHISQMPGVMPGTATHGWTAMRETDLATSRGIASDRVKGGVTAEVCNFMTTRGVAPRRR